MLERYLWFFSLTVFLIDFYHVLLVDKMFTFTCDHPLSYSAFITVNF